MRIEDTVTPKALEARSRQEAVGVTEGVLDAEEMLLRVAPATWAVVLAVKCFLSLRRRLDLILEPLDHLPNHRGVHLL